MLVNGYVNPIAAAAAAAAVVERVWEVATFDPSCARYCMPMVYKLEAPNVLQVLFPRTAVDIWPRKVLQCIHTVLSFESTD